MGGPGDRFQFRLWDLVVVVVGAAYVLDVARRSGLSWGGGLPDLAHAAGLAVLTLGVAVGLVVVGQWAHRLRVEEGRAWATIWRVLAAGWLAGSMVEVAAAMQDLGSPAAVPSLVNNGPLRLRLTALMLALGMVGLVLASYPIGPRAAGPRPAPRPRWGSWPKVLFAAATGLAILGLGHGMFPYFVLMAVDFVHQALRPATLIPRPILFDRMTTAALEAAPGLVGCFLTAAWVDDDLRAAARDPIRARAARSWPGMLARAATAISAAAGGAYSLLVSVPTMSPMLAEGLAMVVEPSTIASVALGFVALAAGFAARGAAHLARGVGAVEGPAGRDSSIRRLAPWGRRVGGVLIGLACLGITASAVQAIRGDVPGRRSLLVRFERLGSFLDAPADRFGYTSGASALREILDRPADWLVAIAAGWLAVRLAALAGSRLPGRSSPMDVLAADRLALGRFLGWWAGLAAATLASLPGLAILGLTLIHLVVRWMAG